MLVPCAQQLVAVSLEMAHNIADFMGRKPGIDRHSHIMKPEFGFFIASPNMDMRRLVAFVGIEERAIRPQRRTVGMSKSPTPPAFGGRLLSGHIRPHPEDRSAGACLE
jgi:hypothetical protein